MNLARRLFLRMTDPLLQKCYWQRLYNSDSGQSKSPEWLNKLLYCDCAQRIHHYQSNEANYHLYLWQHSFLSCIEKRQRQRTVKYWQHKPLISIQLCVYKVDIAHLTACLESVAQQLYPYWQLCIVEDGCGVPEIQRILSEFKQRFPNKVKLILREQNRGITRSSQEAFTQTEGAFVALLDHDDYLAPEALYEVVKRLNQYPETDWFYSDNDKLDTQGLRCCLHAKPAWSPELLMTYNYVLHLSVIRRTLIEKAGGFREGFEGSQDHDLYLRLSEISQKIQHVPRILYSWRQSAESVSLNPDNKYYAYDAALKALDSALQRRKELAYAIRPKHSWLGSYQIIREIVMPDIDVILLSGQDAAPNSLAEQTNIHLHKQINLKADQKVGLQLHKWMEESSSSYCLFLNPYVQFTSQNQLHRLAENLAPKGVSLSSAKIINTNDYVDHCGLAFRQGKILYPLRTWHKQQDGMGAYGALPRNTSLSSPLISLIETSAVQPFLEKLSCYQNFDAWLLALCFELQSAGIRISVDGGISVRYTAGTPYQLTTHINDQTMLQKNYTPFFDSDDGLYTSSMNN